MFKHILAIAITCCLSFQVYGQTNFYEQVENAYNNEDFEKIISLANQVIANAESTKDTTSANLLYYLSDSYLAMDRLEEAMPVMEKEAEIWESLEGANSQTASEVYFSIAYNYSDLNQIEKAIQYFDKSLNGFSQQSAYYFEANIELARLYQKQNSYGKALQSLEKLAKVDSPENQSYYYLAIHKEIGNLYLISGRYSKALEVFNRNLAYTEENFGQQSLQYIDALVFLADTKMLIADYGNAEKLYLRALAINELLNNSSEINEIINNNLGLLYSAIGQYERANDCFAKSYGNDQTISTAISIANQAKVQSKLGEASSAKASYHKSLAIIDSILGQKDKLYFTILKENALHTDLVSGEIDRAIKDLEKSKSLAKESIYKNKPEYSKYEFQLGRAYYRKNAIKAAEKHITTAHKLRNKHLNQTHPLVAETSKELAEINWYKGNIDKSEQLFKEAFNNYFEQIDAYFPALSEQEKANFYTNTLKASFEEFNTFGVLHHQAKPHLLGDMYDYQLATKGLIMYATAKARQKILNSEDTALIQSYNDWIGTKELIARLYSMTPDEIEEQNYSLDSLTQKSNTLEKALSAASEEFLEAYSQKRIRWKEVQKTLKENEAAVEIIRFRQFKPDSSGFFTDEVNYAALVIDQSSIQPELVLFENGQALENKYIKNYKNAIRYKVKDRYSYNFFWKPIAQKLKKYNTIFLSPDGIYNQISINSLVNPETNKYVLEEQNIQLVTNTKDLVAYRNSEDNEPVQNNTASLFGFPNYNKGLENEEEDLATMASQVADNVSLDRGLRGSLQRYIRGNSLVVMLPGTKKEVEKIEELYQRHQGQKPAIHTTDQADENAIKTVQNPQTLHIATHGFFLEDSEPDAETGEDKYAENPLLKSGLILAGANSFITQGFEGSGGQDGILTAYEAMNLDLSGTELVVLSACETGLGDIKNGEGVYGLRRAFQVAGADAIIMSLWSVDDQATQELMTTFYENWLSANSKQEAFRKAQLKIKEQYKDPFYWGAFVMVGE